MRRQRAKRICTHTGLQECVRGDLLAFSLEEIRIARAHSDPREDHHQDPQLTGNKSDPSSALSSLFFCPQLLPPSFSLPFTSFTLSWPPHSPLPLPQISIKIIHLPSSQRPEKTIYEAQPALYRAFFPVVCLCFMCPTVSLTNGNISGLEVDRYTPPPHPIPFLCALQKCSLLSFSLKSLIGSSSASVSQHIHNPMSPEKTH